MFKKAWFYWLFHLIYALTYKIIVLKPALTSTKLLLFKVARGVLILNFKIIAFLNCEFKKRSVDG